jgi:hypothetical protein
MNMTVFWVVVPCNLVETDLIALMIGAGNTFETPVNFFPEYMAQHPRRQSSSAKFSDPDVSTFIKKIPGNSLFFLCRIR